jgi:predicted ATP-dependent serine protease
MLLAEIPTEKVSRIDLGDPALNYLFNGGPIRSGSYLFSGAPGCGKSTWALQCASFFKAPLYVTGEESAEGIKLRAKSTGVDHPKLRVYATRNMLAVADHLAEEHGEDYDGMIFDSADRLIAEQDAGRIGSNLQKNAVINMAGDFALQLGVCVIIVSHVNKSGEASGLKANEHDVTGTIEFEVHDQRRVLTISKHRHGPTYSPGGGPRRIGCVMTGRGLDDFRIVDETVH